MDDIGVGKVAAAGCAVVIANVVLWGLLIAGIAVAAKWVIG